MLDEPPGREKNPVNLAPNASLATSYSNMRAAEFFPISAARSTTTENSRGESTLHERK